MEVTLREFRECDLPALEGWSKAIDSENYMSNIRPATGLFDKKPRERKLLWRVISVSGRDAGAVWIEEAENHQEAVLGILLGENSLLGRGIGKTAIRSALEEARGLFPFQKILLHVRTNNHRAIACYKNCGFTPCGTGVKTNKSGQDIPFLTMTCLLKNRT